LNAALVTAATGEVGRMALVLNVVLFQLGWFACVLGAAHGWPWLGVWVALGVLAWHLARSVQPAREAALLAGAAVVGTAFETLLVQTGWLRYGGGSGLLIEGTAPMWMVALWALFATTLNVSMRALRPRLVLAALLGAVGGPLAYYGGARLGALELVSPGAALAAIGIGWAVLTPLLFTAARRWDGYARP
jgi:hypothetical protein